MLAIPRNDVRVIAERAGISAEDLRRALTVDSYPWWTFRRRLSQLLPDADRMAQGVMAAGLSQMQHSELRSGVLLLTLLHSPLRYIPPAARLLTAINRDQLQQDFAAWDKRIRRIRGSGWRANARATETGDTLLPATPKHDRRRPR